MIYMTRWYTWHDITIVAIYVPNIQAPKYIKHIKYLKEEINSNTIIVREFNTLPTSMDRSYK